MSKLNKTVAHTMGTGYIGLQGWVNILKLKTELQDSSNNRKGNVMWTRSYFVSTAGQVSLETIKQYVEV